MTLVGRVLRSQSGYVWVDTERGVVRCTLRGRLKRDRKAKTDLAVIGDRVRVEWSESGDGTIEAVEPRANRFARRAAGGRGVYKEDVLVANLDRLFAVFSCARPPMNPRLVDRFLVIAELDSIVGAIVANKVDEVDRETARAQFGLYEELGYRVFYTSALDGTGIDELRAELNDRVSAFVGPSGVGKSSILNRVEPGLGLSVGELSESLDKGRHTTRVAELHPLSDGGWVADTPGIRELASFQLPEAELAQCFPDLRPFLGECRFPSCRHLYEPECAVRAAVDRGAIRPERYDSYLRILQGSER
jgi:ribosome biogenesis GTPase / thiamine phosphate phosphatase